MDDSPLYSGRSQCESRRLSAVVAAMYISRTTAVDFGDGKKQQQTEHVARLIIRSNAPATIKEEECFLPSYVLPAVPLCFAPSAPAPPRTHGSSDGALVEWYYKASS
jgi:hypothetical protein